MVLPGYDVGKEIRLVEARCRGCCKRAMTVTSEGASQGILGAI